MEFISTLLMQSGLVLLSFLLGTIIFLGYFAIGKFSEKNILLVVFGIALYNTILGYIILYPWIIGEF